MGANILQSWPFVNVHIQDVGLMDEFTIHACALFIAKSATANYYQDVAWADEVQGMLEARTWWSATSLYDRPKVFMFADCEPVKFVILNSDVRCLSSNTTKDVYSFELNLFRDQVPFDFRQFL